MKELGRSWKEFDHKVKATYDGDASGVSIVELYIRLSEKRDVDDEFKVLITLFVMEQS